MVRIWIFVKKKKKCHPCSLKLRGWPRTTKKTVCDPWPPKACCPYTFGHTVHYPHLSVFLPLLSLPPTIVLSFFLLSPPRHHYHLLSLSLSLSLFQLIAQSFASWLRSLSAYINCGSVNPSPALRPCVPAHNAPIRWVVQQPLSNMAAFQVCAHVLWYGLLLFFFSFSFFSRSIKVSESCGVWLWMWSFVKKKSISSSWCEIRWDDYFLWSFIILYFLRLLTSTNEFKLL